MKFASACFLLVVLGCCADAVRFFEHAGFGGNFYRAPPGWANGCTNVPEWINDKASAVNTEGHCIIVYEHGDCRGSTAHIFPGSSGHSDLHSVGMGDRISSYRGCGRRRRR